MGVPRKQRDTAALLAQLTGAAHPIETHISAVLVGPTRAFKLKKAVALGFLDFTALDAREHFCRRELALNAPHAPGLYRAVHAVTRGGDGALRLEPADAARGGEVVDWVLEMAPLPPEDFLDAVAARGGVDAAMADALGDVTAALHESLPPLPGADAPGAMRAALDGNVGAALAAGLPPAAIFALAREAGAWLDRHGAVLAARAAAGRVRRCHGDLHLGNLVLRDERPTAFDALEFDEALATVDTGYDLAFLLMDLDRRAGRETANRVLSRYVARTGDAGLVAGLPFWLAMRALVRAHCVARSGAPGGAARSGAPGAAARDDHAAECVALLGAAAGYLRPAAPRVVAVGGLQGTGKTRLARALAPHLGAAPGALVLRTDEVRKRLAGVAPEQRLPPESYAPGRSAAVHAVLLAMLRDAASGGHAVVADALFLDPATRAGVAAAAGAAGVPFLGSWLEAPLPLLRARVAARRGDASDAGVAVLEAAARADPGPLDGWLRLDAATDPVPAALALLADAVARTPTRRVPDGPAWD